MDLQQLVQSIEPATLFIEPRILRRIIRLDRKLQSFHLLVPHRENYTIDRERLLALVEHSELDLNADAELPARLILLPRSDDEEGGNENSIQQQINRNKRRLFHGGVHLELEHAVARKDSVQAWVDQRHRQIGELAFAEIRDVLLNDQYLFQGASDCETYVEFAAVYLELLYFAPFMLPCYFPAIRDWKEVDRIVSQDINHQQLFHRLHSPTLTAGGRQLPASAHPVQRRFSTRLPIRSENFELLKEQAQRAAATGNNVKAILANWHAAALAPPACQADAHAAAHLELLRFAERLGVVLQLHAEETESLVKALEPLLEPVAEQDFSGETRFLYDLQKACLAQEQEIRRIDLVQWVLAKGKRPLDRPLPLLSEVLVLRHLRSARRRIASAHVEATKRQPLLSLLDRALPHLESDARDRLRAIISDVLMQVGIQPQNVPERIAAQKVTQELVDQILERSYLRMADLRDTLSRNDLKLPDVTGVSDIVGGDHLLEADRRFGAVLDGVYRRGAIYQRLPQMLSSMAFGTAIGRFLTLYLVVPYGGAFLILECLRHLGFLPGVPVPSTEQLMDPDEAYPSVRTSVDILFVSVVLMVGTWLSLLIHRPVFRAWNLTLLRKGGRLARELCIDLPARILHSTHIQRILASSTFAVVRDYLLRPGLVTAVLWGLANALGDRWSQRLTLEVFLVAALFLNSSLGTLVAEIVTNYLVCLWHNLKIRVLASAVQWVNDLFRGLLRTLEKIVYATDEWLRFRSGDNGILKAVKLTGGVVWFFLAYFVVFVFTLLVEPQINPIKHFPVVTVSHKLLLPTGPVIAQQLTPYLGRARANTLVWTSIWLVPGIFGFLVWELKENWRLYAANRPRLLRSESVSHHGETILRLLRPGFHSGTLPKAFAALRRSARKSGSAEDHQLRGRWTAIQRVESDVTRFVNRQFISLLKEVGFARQFPLAVSSVQTSVSRIAVVIARTDLVEEPLLLAWEYRHGRLLGVTAAAGWIDRLDRYQRKTLKIAVAGLFQRSGVETVSGPLASDTLPAISWDEWVETWRNLPKCPTN